MLREIEAAIAERLINAPDTLVRQLTRERRVVDGEPMDRRAQYMFLLGTFAERSMPRIGVKNARRYYERLNRALETAPPPIARTSELTIPARSGQRAARAYYPPGESGNSPCLVYYHGGGFTVGSIDTHDTLCRRLCALADCVVVSVDYRLAPEHPFPAAVEDCFDAYRWVVGKTRELGIVADRIGVGGDSAGGNLATVIASLARDEGVSIPWVQLLLYPAVGTYDHIGRRKPEVQTGYGLDAKTTKWFFHNYVPAGQESNPRLAPLHLDSHRGLPPAIIVTAQFDLLWGEGADYVAALEAAAVPVTHIHVTDLPHGFATMSALPRSREAIREIAQPLRKALHA